mmetsp:Transcript_26189/g.80895  ORF Transcript_26189/g.80895 Transcript_26189/m.80895 type:complete len:224 (-) Transcript_26189:1569-2240(-)
MLNTHPSAPSSTLTAMTRAPPPTCELRTTTSPIWSSVDAMRSCSSGPRRSWNSGWRTKPSAVACPRRTSFSVATVWPASDMCECVTEPRDDAPAYVDAASRRSSGSGVSTHRSRSSARSYDTPTTTPNMLAPRSSAGWSGFVRSDGLATTRAPYSSKDFLMAGPSMSRVVSVAMSPRASVSVTVASPVRGLAFTADTVPSTSWPLCTTVEPVGIGRPPMSRGL